MRVAVARSTTGRRVWPTPKPTRHHDKIADARRGSRHVSDHPDCPTTIRAELLVPRAQQSTQPVQRKSPRGLDKPFQMRLAKPAKRAWRWAARACQTLRRVRRVGPATTFGRADRFAFRAASAGRCGADLKNRECSPSGPARKRSWAVWRLTPSAWPTSSQLAPSSSRAAITSTRASRPAAAASASAATARSRCVAPAPGGKSLRVALLTSRSRAAVSGVAPSITARNLSCS